MKLIRASILISLGHVGAAFWGCLRHLSLACKGNVEIAEYFGEVGLGGQHALLP